MPLTTNPKKRPLDSSDDKQSGYLRVLKYGDDSIISCDLCFSEGFRRVVMSTRSGKTLACAECRRMGHRCVSMSWDTVDRAVDKAELELKETERERDAQIERLAEVQARLARKRKMLEFAQQRAKEQLRCLEDEMIERGEENIFAEIREASSIERELFGPLDAVPGGTSLAIPDTR